MVFADPADDVPATRSATLQRVMDARGDAREQFVLKYELARLGDRLGDLEERRLHTAFARGRVATLHVRLKREIDRAGDRVQRQLARLPLSRRNADLRRLRDLNGDREELVSWKRDYLRYGPDRAREVGLQAEQRVDEAAAHADERKKDLRETGEEEQAQRSDERGDERDLERDLQNEGRHGGDEEAEDELDEAMEEAMEEALEDIDAEERAEDREFESETEKTIQQEEGGGVE